MKSGLLGLPGSTGAALSHSWGMTYALSPLLGAPPAAQSQVRGCTWQPTSRDLKQNSKRNATERVHQNIGHLLHGIHYYK